MPATDVPLPTPARASKREIWGHAVANITPSAMPAVTIALVALHGGQWTWLVYALVGVVMLLVAQQIGTLARHFPSAGSLFVYLAQALHPIVGLVAGFTMILGYGGALLAAPLLFGLFSGAALQTLWPALGQHALIPLSIAGLILAWSLARQGVELSARWGLWIEWLSVGCILLICIMTLWHFGWVDPAQWHWTHFQAGDFLTASVLAVLAYGGFETAGNLAGEAREPGSIPAIMSWAVLLVGIFFVVTAYTETVAFSALKEPLGAAQTPLNTIAIAMGQPWLGALVDVAMATAAFSASIATLNSISRILQSMARHNVLPRRLASTHPRHGTPTPALGALALLVLAGIATVWLAQLHVLLLVDIFGTFTGLGFVLLYGLANVAAVRFQFLRGFAGRWASLLIALLSLPLLGAVLYGTVDPFPGGAVGGAILFFLLVVVSATVIGIAWAIWSPERLQGILQAPLGQEPR